MSDNKLSDLFKNAVPDISDKEIEDAIAAGKKGRGKLQAGQYKLRSLGTTATISKAQKEDGSLGGGTVMAVEELVALNESNKPTNTSVKTWHKLPIKPKPEMLALAGYPADKIDTVLANHNTEGHNGMNLNEWRRRLRAGFGKESFPDYPQFDREAKEWRIGGTAVSQEEAAAAKAKLVRGVKEAAYAVISNDALLKGQEVYVYIDYEKPKDGKKPSDFPRLQRWSAYPLKDDKGVELPVIFPK